MTDPTATPRTEAQPFRLCIDCGHDEHPFRGYRDVRCGAPTNLHGDPGNGPEPCECVQWEDVLAAYQAIDRKGDVAARLREDVLEALGELISGLHVPRSMGSVMVPRSYDTVRNLIRDFGYSYPEEVTDRLRAALRDTEPDR